MKRFTYDEIIDRENFCNMQSEIAEVMRLIEDKRNVVLYAPRNYGKTSLIKSIVMPDFQKKYKNTFVIFMDLFDMKDEFRMHHIMQRDFERAFAKAFPAKILMNKAAQFLQRFNPQFSIDALTGQASFSLSSTHSESKKLTFDDIFDLIIAISKDHPTLVIIDEFQSVSRINGTDALFRSKFQIMKQIPIILMGSQKHMLLDLFTNPAAPLADFGNDVELQPIQYEIYHHYILERFQGIHITTEMTKLIQDRMNRVPESINILAHNVFLYATQHGVTQIDSPEIIHLVIDDILNKKRSKFENMLYSLTKNEEKVLIAFADQTIVKAPGSIKFLSKVGLSSRGTKMIIDKLLDSGFLDRSFQGYSIANPLLKLYLQRYR